MAVRANLQEGTAHFDRKARFMALAAFLIFVRRMRVELDFNDRVGLNWGGRAVQWFSVLIVNNDGRVGGVGVWDPVKEGRQPLLLGFGLAAREEGQPKKNPQPSAELPVRRCPSWKECPHGSLGSQVRFMNP